MSKLTGVQMKYLHTIYRTQKDDQGVRSVDIAGALRVSKASVHRMVKLLSELEFVSMENRGNVKLTLLGKDEGTKIEEKYKKVYPFFIDYLELEQSEALECTYSFLCNFSDTCIRRLTEREQKRGIIGFN